MTLVGKRKRKRHSCGRQDNSGRSLESGAGVLNVFGVAGWGSAEGCWEHNRGTGICEQNNCLTC